MQDGSLAASQRDNYEVNPSEQRKDRSGRVPVYAALGATGSSATHTGSSRQMTAICRSAIGRLDRWRCDGHPVRFLVEKQARKFVSRLVRPHPPEFSSGRRLALHTIHTSAFVAESRR
jgi:hypothetical protein